VLQIIHNSFITFCTNHTHLYPIAIRRSPDHYHRRVHKLSRDDVPLDVVDDVEDDQPSSHNSVHHQIAPAKRTGVSNNHGDVEVPISLSPDIDKRSEVS